MKLRAAYLTSIFVLFALILLSCSTGYGPRVARQKEKPAKTEQASEATGVSQSQSSPEDTESTQAAQSPKVEFGKAAYYNDSFQGKKTISGEIYDRNKLSAAHPSLPMGTKCRVTNMKNGKSVELHINDRCSSKNGRILDLSYEAASRLDGIKDGIMEVKLEILE